MRTPNNFKHEKIEPELKSAFDIRRKNFSPEMFFFAPTLKKYECEEFARSNKPVFVPISLTGPNCTLNCKHCGGTLLESMYWANTPDELLAVVEKLIEKGIEGLLITGGSCIDGSVPMKPFFPALKRIKQEMNLKLAAHTGLVDKETASKMKEVFDIAMLDIIGSKETIREIYNLDKEPVDFYNSVKYLVKQNIAVVPHIVVGLHYGEILGEFKAMQSLAHYNLSSLVIVITKKLKGTEFYRLNVKPPSLDSLKEIFIFARETFPKTPLLIGCARPGGRMEREIDILAVKSGFNGIAYPSEEVIAFSKSAGLQPKFSQYCCSFISQMG